VEVAGQVVVQEGAVQAHALARFVQVLRGHPGPGHVRRQLHDTVGRPLQLVQRLRQTAPELFPY
jgi:hypothetical protein